MELFTYMYMCIYSIYVYMYIYIHMCMYTYMCVYICVYNIYVSIIRLYIYKERERERSEGNSCDVLPGGSPSKNIAKISAKQLSFNKFDLCFWPLSLPHWQQACYEHDPRKHLRVGVKTPCTRFLVARLQFTDQDCDEPCDQFAWTLWQMCLIWCV